ncbi:unnamed protein product [Periconia digitata]|uniref:Uncharacterized protein n=1 Tax=Periconia digitata TaxID=1303443 RepID=A0A9W4U6H0_9PLEO|nr:unnamed protein product [Periconia digitata]
MSPLPSPSIQKANMEAKEVLDKATAKVKKPARKRLSKKYLQALQRPTAPAGKRYPVKIMADGLVSVQSVPDYLVIALVVPPTPLSFRESPADLCDSFRRNTKESPLLRLPKNVREKIWNYALYEGAIEIYLREDEPKPSPPSPSCASPASGEEPRVDNDGDTAHLFSESTSGLEYRPPFYGTLPIPSGPGKRKIKHAWNLPTTSRQIYSETATLVYSLNTFVFAGTIPESFGERDGPDGALEGWAAERTRAQLDAITSIRPHWLDLLAQIDSRNGRVLRQYYPSLKTIVCAKRAVGYTSGWVVRGDLMRSTKRSSARLEIERKIKAQEGRDVEIVF